MLEQRKGITPVIAIVLLLLVTVGAVGVVYTQFQNIVDQGSTQAGFLDEVNVKYTVVRRNSSSPASTDTMQIVLENTGTDEYNLQNISRLEYSTPGEQSIRALTGSVLGFDYSSGADNCFDSDALQGFGPGDIATCNTGVEMPAPDEEMTLHLIKDASDQTSTIDTYTCSPSTSDSTTC